MRHTFPLVALLLVASGTVAGPPTSPVRRGPPIDLVAAPPIIPTPVLFPVWGGGYWGNPYWGGFYGNPYWGGFPQPPVVIVPQPVFIPPPPNPIRQAEDADRAAANLTLELPAAGEVWVNDEKQPSSDEKARTLASPLLPLGREFTFNIRGRWVEGNTTYETRQTSTVRAGERGKLTVYAGKPVK